MAKIEENDDGQTYKRVAYSVVSNIQHWSIRDTNHEMPKKVQEFLWSSVSILETSESGINTQCEFASF